MKADEKSLTSKDVLNIIAPQHLNGTADEIFYEGYPEWVIDAMEEYAHYKLQALKEEVEKERFALLDLNESRATGRNNEFEKGIDRGLEISLNLITNLEK